MSTWPDPEKPGVPLNPERDGWHWLQVPQEGFPPTVVCWRAGDQDWDRNLGPGYSYLGPVLTPAEADALKSDLQCWKECSHAFQCDLEAARAENARLREALSAFLDDSKVHDFGEWLEARMKQACKALYFDKQQECRTEVL